MIYDSIATDYVLCGFCDEFFPKCDTEKHSKICPIFIAKKPFVVYSYGDYFEKWVERQLDPDDEKEQPKLFNGDKPASPLQRVKSPLVRKKTPLQIEAELPTPSPEVTVRPISNSVREFHPRSASLLEKNNLSPLQKKVLSKSPHPSVEEIRERARTSLSKGYDVKKHCRGISRPHNTIILLSDNELVWKSKSANEFSSIPLDSIFNVLVDDVRVTIKSKRRDLVLDIKNQNERKEFVTSLRTLIDEYDIE